MKDVKAAVPLNDERQNGEPEKELNDPPSIPFLNIEARQETDNVGISRKKNNLLITESDSHQPSDYRIKGPSKT